MQFLIEARDKTPDLHAVEQLLRAADPSAVADIGGPDQHLRISTNMSKFELVEVMQAAGFVTEFEQVTQLPSECCGGCGG